MSFLTKFKKIVTLSLYCITLALICQAFCPISSAFALTTTTYDYDDFHFEDFTADYYLSKAEDGTSRLRVKESFITEFPEMSQNHGITRIIPFTNQDGENLTMASDKHLDIKIKHNGITERPHKVEVGDGYFTVYIGNPKYYVHETQYYELEYEFRNVITEFSEDGRSWQELYWDTNGNDWRQKFNQVTARVHFADQEIKDNATGEAWCYVGLYGYNDEDRCQVLHTADGFEFRVSNLRARENLSFDIEFQPGSFKMGQPINDYRFVAAFTVVVVGGIAMLGICFCIWQKVKDKRKFYQDLFVKPEYTPPRDFTVAEMAENYMSKGTLGSKQVATLMELAVQHKIEIIQNQATGKAKDKWIVRVKSLDLKAEQAIALKILTGKDKSLYIGQEIPVKSHTATSSLIQLGNDFDKNVRNALRSKGLLEYDEKKAEKLAESKSKAEPTAKNPCSALVVITFFWFFLGIMACPFLIVELPAYHHLIGGWGLFTATLIIFIAVLATMITVGARLSPYFTHTTKGLEYSRYLDGLRDYIKMAEKDRIEFLQSVKGADTSHEGIVKLYEKLLPYAVVFRLEKSWLKEMARYYEYSDVSTPTWYVGATIFSADQFASALSSASSYMASTTTHSTSSGSSSSFSGGGGGGFSGGGGGGGGGGGW